VLRAGKIAGSVVGLDGVTALDGARVVVRGPDGAIVAQAVADRTGRFDLGVLAAGEYSVEVGAAAGLVRIAAEAGARDLLLVLAPEVARATRAAQDTTASTSGDSDSLGDDEEKTITLAGVEFDETTGMLIGAGGAVAIGGGIAVGAAAVAGGGSSHHSTVTGNPSVTKP
jgi:hypothetical protein